MCSEIDRFSSFSRRNMSGSKNTLRPFAEEEDESKSLLASKNEEIASEMEERENRDDQKDEVGEIKNEEDADCKVRVTVSVSLDKQLPDSSHDDDDGFRTPTTLDHKIPVIIQCPPAPRKPRPEPSRLKRKASPPLACELDAARAEIESIFQPISSQDGVEEKKPKKARRDDED